MIRLAWKQILYSGFILFLFFSGCSQREASIEELILQAEDLQNVGQFEAAVTLLEGALQREPNRVDVLEELAFAYAADKDPMSAAMNFMRIAELVPDQPEYFIYAANSMTDGGDLVGAVEIYKQYLQKNPSDRAVWLILANLQQDRGNLSGALEAYLAADKVTASVEQQVTIARLYLQLDNLVQAQSWFARALEGDSDYRDDALLGLLETAIRTRRFADADTLLKQLDAEYPGLVDRSALETVREQLADWGRRREAAKTALAALEGRNSEELQEAVEQTQSGEPLPETSVEEESPVRAVGQPVGDPPPAEAIETPVAVEPPVQLVETAAPANVAAGEENVGLARQRRDEGKLDEAISLYKTALIENDNQPQIWSELSALYLRSGNHRWAQATASEAMRLMPDNPEFVLQFLLAASRTMEPNRFVEEMEKAYKQFPEDPGLLLFMGRFFADQDNIRNARILLEKFLEYAPPNHPQRTTVQMELADFAD